MSCQIKEEERETYVLTWPRGARRRGRGRDGPGSEVPATNEGVSALGQWHGSRRLTGEERSQRLRHFVLSLHSFQAVPMKEESRLRRRWKRSRMYREMPRKRLYYISNLCLP